MAWPHDDFPRQPVRPASRLARLQQALVVLGALASAVSALWLWWAWALVLPAIGWTGYAASLAIEFLWAARVGRAEGEPLPAERAVWMRAWWQECGWGPRVFAWWQPFRWRACPDTAEVVAGRTAVVLVHGFVCNRGFWMPWMRRLRQVGRPYVSVSLEPLTGSLDAYVPQIEVAVQKAERLTGRPPLLVGHSMGGLAIRAWLASTPAAQTRVARVLTIGSPHHGTWLARFSRTVNGRQMQRGSKCLQALAARERQQHAEPYGCFICWYADTDNVVFPVRTATLPGADNRLVSGAPHVGLAFHPVVVGAALQLAEELDVTPPAGDGQP